MDSNLNVAMEQLSIAEARQSLPALVHQVEKTGACQLTRRGRPVAVLLSQAEYERLAHPPADTLWQAIVQSRPSFEDALDDEDLDDLRDRSPGREFSWPD